jgi:hypothetical protein
MSGQRTPSEILSIHCGICSRTQGEREFFSTEGYGKVLSMFNTARNIGGEQAQTADELAAVCRACFDNQLFSAELAKKLNQV